MLLWPRLCIYFLLLLNLYYSTLNLKAPMWKSYMYVFSNTIKQVIEFWYKLPGIGVSSHNAKLSTTRLPTSDASHEYRCHPWFWPVVTNPRLPMASSLGWIHLLKQLTELRKTFTHVCQFIIKSIIKDTMKRARWRASSGGRAWSIHAFSERTPLPRAPRVHQPKALPVLFLGVFVEASLYRNDW